MSTPCGAVSSQGIVAFVTDSLALHMIGRISDPGKGLYTLRLPLASGTPAIRQTASGVSTLDGAVPTQGIAVCVPNLLDP